jgi:hypothetical protein
VTVIDDPGNRYRFRPPVGERSTIDPTDIESPIPPHEDSMEFLKAVMSSPDQPMSRRMRAAVALIPHQYPKLSVVSGGPNIGFARDLEAKRAQRLLAGGSAFRNDEAEGDGNG